MHARGRGSACFREMCTRGRTRARSPARRRWELLPYENLMKGYMATNKDTMLHAASATVQQNLIP